MKNNILRSLFWKRFPRFKDKGLTIDRITNDFKTNITVFIYKEYQTRLIELNCVDFGDILLYVLDILQKNPDILKEYQERFKYIMVDEYQDTNVTQYLLLRLLSQNTVISAASAMMTNPFIPGEEPRLKTS